MDLHENFTTNISIYKEKLIKLRKSSALNLDPQNFQRIIQQFGSYLWKAGMQRNAILGPGNLSLECSSCKIIGFQSQNLRSWAQQVSTLRYSNLVVNESFIFHIITIINSQCWMLIQNFTKLKKKREIMLNTFSGSLMIWDPARAQEMNGGSGNEMGDPESWTVPPPWKLYFNPCEQGSAH